MTKEETWENLVALVAVNGRMPHYGWDLRGVDLRGANLGAVYKNLELRRVVLSGADLSEARLS